MIDKKEFYGNEATIPFRSKSRMWKNIKNELKPGHSGFFASIEYRSFAFGMAAAVILFFTSVGIKTTWENYMETRIPVNQKINTVYTDAIGKFESTLPVLVKGAVKSNRQERLLAVKKEELETIDEAIKLLNNDLAKNDNSPLIQSKLRELYGMKLKVIGEILSTEGENR